MTQTYTLGRIEIHTHTHTHTHRQNPREANQCASCSDERKKEKEKRPVLQALFEFQVVGGRHVGHLGQSKRRSVSENMLTSLFSTCFSLGKRLPKAKENLPKQSVSLVCCVCRQLVLGSSERKKERKTKGKTKNSCIALKVSFFLRLSLSWFICTHIFLCLVVLLMSDHGLV